MRFSERRVKPISRRYYFISLCSSLIGTGDKGFGVEYGVGEKRACGYQLKPFR